MFAIHETIIDETNAPFRAVLFVIEGDFVDSFGTPKRRALFRIWQHSFGMGNAAQLDRWAEHTGWQLLCVHSTTDDEWPDTQRRLQVIAAETL